MAAQTGTREASIHRVASLPLEGDGHASGLNRASHWSDFRRENCDGWPWAGSNRGPATISNCYSKQRLEHRLNVGSPRAGGLECAGAALVSMSTVSMSISAMRPWPAAPAAASITLRVTCTARCPASTASCACGERSVPMCIRSRPCRDIRALTKASHRLVVRILLNLRV